MNEQLKSRIKAFLRGDIDRISTEQFAKACYELGRRDRSPVLPQNGQSDISLPQTLRDLEAEAIVQAVQFHRGNRLQAARSLGIGKTTLYFKIHAYGLEARIADIKRG